MSKYKEQIKSFAWDINDGLSDYIYIHNRILKKAGSFKSFIKNIFGTQIPMSQLLTEAESLIPTWNTILNNISTFYNESYSSIDEDEKQYFNILYKYAKTLNKTVYALIETQKLLSNKNKGNTVNWETFKEAENKYKSAIREYKLYGKELNELNHLIFE